MTLKSTKKWIPYLFITLPLLCIIWVRIIPLCYAVWLSLTNFHLLRGGRFIGFGNYEKLLHDEVFIVAIKNTIYYTALFGFCVVIFGLLLALIGIKLKGIVRTLYRSLCFVPAVISMVAAAYIWRNIYGVQYGFLNQILKMLGFGKVNWLGDPDLVLNSIVLLSVWKGVGFVMIILMAGLFEIPNVYYEAAQIDGAGSWRKFVHITLPLLRPTFLYVVVTQIIGAFQVFTQTYVLTDGGPGLASTTVVLEIYQRGFRFFRMGEASAMSFILFGVILFVVLLQFKLFRSELAY